MLDILRWQVATSLLVLAQKEKENGNEKKASLELLL